MTPRALPVMLPTVVGASRAGRAGFLIFIPAVCGERIIFLGYFAFDDARLPIPGGAQLLFLEGGRTTDKDIQNLTSSHREDSVTSRSGHLRKHHAGAQVALRMGWISRILLYAWAASIGCLSWTWDRSGAKASPLALIPAQADSMNPTKPDGVLPGPRGRRFLGKFQAQEIPS